MLQEVKKHGPSTNHDVHAHRRATIETTIMCAHTAKH